MTIEIKSKDELNKRLIDLETFLFVESFYHRSPRRAEFEKHLRAVKLARACLNSAVDYTIA